MPVLQAQDMTRVLEDEKARHSAAQQEHDRAMQAAHAELEGRRQEAEVLRATAGKAEDKALADLKV